MFVDMHACMNQIPTCTLNFTAEGDGSSSENHRPELIINAGESVAVRKAKYFFRDLFLVNSTSKK